jgi:hypothetical protein
MALLAKLRRQRYASGEGEDGENRVLGDPFIETQRCFCLQHRVSNRKKMNSWSSLY